MYFLFENNIPLLFINNIILIKKEYAMTIHNLSKPLPDFIKKNRITFRRTYLPSEKSTAFSFG